LDEDWKAEDARCKSLNHMRLCPIHRYFKRFMRPTEAKGISADPRKVSSIIVGKVLSIVTGVDLRLTSLLSPIFPPGHGSLGSRVFDREIIPAGEKLRS